MSDKIVARNRFHRGTTAAFRRLLRRAGISFDEEQAQFVLAGIQPFAGQPSELVDEARDEVLSHRHENNKAWEEANPGKNPYPPSFPDRVLRLVRLAQQECLMEEASPLETLARLEAIARAELRTDPFGPADDAPND